MKDGDTVRVNLPGDPGHGLIGYIVRIDQANYYWVWLAEHPDSPIRYVAKDLLAVRPQL